MDNELNKFCDFHKVYIIESFSKKDSHLCEKNFLSTDLTSLEISHECYDVNSKKDFKNALEQIKEDMIEIQYEEEYYSFFFPIIHISCHGSDGLIALSNDEKINWNELNDLFIEIDFSIAEIYLNSLTLSMSSCYGLYAIYADIEEGAKGSSPFAFVIGHEDKITSVESAKAYSQYYKKLIIQKCTMNDSIKAMNESIKKTNHFKLFLSNDTFEIFKHKQ